MKILTRLIQLLLILTPLVILCWLLQEQFAPSGIFVVHTVVGDHSPFIDRLLPDTRVHEPVQENGQWIQEVTGDPAFFFVHPQRQFDTATVELWFQNENVPIVEFGGLARTSPEVYDLQPMQNLLIDQSSWSRITDGDQVLLQRTKTFNSIQDFLGHLPAPDTIAAYHTDILPPFRLKGYQSSSTEQTINVSLRGHHKFKTYLKDETLSARFEYMDMNRDEGADPVVVTVFDEEGRPVGDARADDDGDLSKLGRSSGMRSVELSLPGLSEGVYKIVFDVSRDIFLRNIKTTQTKFVAVNGVYLGDEIGYREPGKAVTLYTTAKRIQSQTRHSEGVQTLSVGGKPFAIEEPYKLYIFTSQSPGVIDVRVDKLDIELFVDQPIAFSPADFFNPEPNRLRYYTDVDAEGIDYIIANYRSSEKRGDWYVATMDVDLGLLHFETEHPDLQFFRDGNWKFVVSSAGIEERGGSIKIHEINMTFHGRPITATELLQHFKN